jgi:hypothetical protein
MYPRKGFRVFSNVLTWLMFCLGLFTWIINLNKQDFILSSKISKKYNIISALAAFVVWGGWAYYINDTGTENVRAISAATQGISSLIITLALVKLVSLIFNRLPRKITSVFIASILSVTCSGSCLIAVHYLIGTPEIVGTVSPPLLVAFLFCLFTAYKLHSDPVNA